MAASGPRFCPRCGTARVGDMGFCPNCGLDLGRLPADDRSPGEPSPSDRDTVAAAPAPGGREEAPWDGEGRSRLLLPGLLVLVVLLAGAWLAGIGPFARPGDRSDPFAGGTATAAPTSAFLPAVTPLPSLSLPPGLTAPPVGLTILSPADGSVVGAREVTVIGTAPPGLRITQDISFGFDRHATSDGTGHWAIQVELSEGENQLKFRIGDDPSTAQTVRVVYLPPSPG
jgi:hypothetical protein